MDTSLERIALEAMSLGPAQRAELADFLVQSLESTEPDEIQLAWFREAQRRLEELRAGTTTAISGEEVVNEARRLVGR